MIPVNAPDLPLLLVERGQLLHERLARTRVAEQDILDAARRSHGIERLDQIRYALLETDGGISIIPCSSPLDRDPPPVFPPTEQMR